MRTTNLPDSWEAIRIILSLLLVLNWSAGCSSSGEPAERFDQLISLQGRTALRLEISAGEITVMGGGAGDEVKLQGQYLANQPLQFSTEALPGQLIVRFLAERRPFGGYRSSPLSLAIIIPDNLSVTIESFEANTRLENFRGQLQHTTVAGNIQARNVHGEIALVSARGDITVQQASGQLRVLAEHGAIILEEVQGSVGSSTIMGSIRYRGQPAAGDEIRVEVDHGPVEILLAPETDLEVLIRSTSGEVVCLAPALQSSARGCQGVLGAGGASLAVRTVSGNVTLRLGVVFP